jgi:hypothetical protein
VVVVGADDGRLVGVAVDEFVLKRVEEAEGDARPDLWHLRVGLVDEVHLNGRQHDDLIPRHEHGPRHWTEGRALELKDNRSAAVNEDVEPVGREWKLIEIFAREDLAPSSLFHLQSASMPSASFHSPSACGERETFSVYPAPAAAAAYHFG